MAYAELFDSQTLTQTGVDRYVLERIYLIQTKDPVAALAQIPQYDSEHPTLNIFVKSIKVESYTDSAGYFFNKAVVTYRSLEKSGEQRNENNEVWEYDLVSRMVHITNVESDVQSDTQTWQSHHPTGVATTDGGTAINADDEGVKGVDVYRPYRALTVTKWFDPSIVTAEFRETIASMGGTVNKEEWQGNQPGEVLFLGARVREIDDQESQVVYQFLLAKNRTQVKLKRLEPLAKESSAIYAEFTLDKVDAFQYLWFKHGEIKDPAFLSEGGEGQTYRGILSAGLATTYLADDFSKLLIEG